MSLMNTVTKMAIGFAVAKGMAAVQRKGGIGSMVQELSGAGSQSGGLGGLLGQLGAAGAAGGAPGGLGDLLGQFTGGAGSNVAGLGGLGALLGGLAGARGAADGNGLEALLNRDNPDEEPDEEATALLMMRAMIQAARADGDIDPDEKTKLLDMLKDGDPADTAVVQSLLTEPVDPGALASETPKGLETQVYTMSVNAISPDNQAEVEHLHRLAEGLGLAPDTVNAIHRELGVAPLYG